MQDLIVSDSLFAGTSAVRCGIIVTSMTLILEVDMNH